MDSNRPGSFDRRSFVTRALTGLGGAWLAGSGLAHANPLDAAVGRPGRRPVPGVQLYTVRDRMQQDVAATLEQVAEIGYREVEFAGYHGWTPEQLRLLLDRLGLAAPSAHVPIDAMRTRPDQVLGAAATLGHRFVIIPWLAEQDRGSVEAYRRVAGELNRFGEAARKRGIRMGYHNHDFEFDPLEGGRTGYDVLLAETDPALVDMELDLFWAVKAGHEPVDLFRRHPGRFPLAHVKDMADIQGAQRMTEVGSGEIDFGRIFAAADTAGLRHFFVEHDRPADPMTSIRTSYRSLHRLLS